MVILASGPGFVKKARRYSWEIRVLDFDMTVIVANDVFDHWLEAVSFCKEMYGEQDTDWTILQLENT